MIRLHGFCQSGNTYKVAFFLRALGVPHEMVNVDFLHGQTRDPAWRERTNEMGEAPVLDDGERRLTQSGAILTYLARKHARYEGRDEDERLEALRWILFDNHKFTSYLASYRFMRCFGPAAPDPAVMNWLKPRIEGAFSIVDKHLATRPWMAGEAPTIADFSLCGYLFYPEEEIGLPVRERWPQIGAWLERVQGLPGWADPYEILPGERVAPKWLG